MTLKEEKERVIADKDDELVSGKDPGDNQSQKWQLYDRVLHLKNRMIYPGKNLIE